MAATDINIDAYIDALLVLGTAGVVVPVVRRFGGSSVLGFLAAGAILGPLGLGAMKYDAHILLWMTVADARNVSGIAELGVVFLLFLIGLELSLSRLLTMRRLVFGLGGLQVALTAAVLMALASILGVSPPAALVLGLCLALSSTAIVLDVLSGHRRLSTAAGRVGFAVLLAQDLAVIPLFLLIAVFAATGSGSVLGGLFSALVDGGITMLAIVAAGRFLLRPLFRLVAGTGAQELFTAATLFVVVGAGVAAALAGLSMALGAFTAGLMLAETEYRKAIENIIEPFKALLLGVFFFTIGMKIDLREVFSHPLAVAGAVAALILLKATIAYGLMRVFKVGHAAALLASLLLGPGGEFAFVGVGLAVTAKLVPQTTASFVLAVASISMALIPVLYHVARWLEGGESSERPFVEPPPSGEADHVVIVGYGRFGRLVSDMLAAHGIEYLAVDSDPAAAASERARGKLVYYGNAVDLGYLERCGLAAARALVVTVHDQKAIDEIVRLTRTAYPDLKIIVRARDAEHARHLYALGVTDAVPETIEASLQLSEAVLVEVGLPAGPVIASIHEKRDEFRHALQDAAESGGQSATRSIRSKTLRRG
jgi:CPA2 family monovalent cation:H+ antiporter-2